MGRRFLLLFASAALTATGVPKPKAGDADWVRKFRAFMKAMNEFLLTLNEDIFDVAKWERVRSAWHHLDSN